MKKPVLLIIFFVLLIGAGFFLYARSNAETAHGAAAAESEQIASGLGSEGVKYQNLDRVKTPGSLPCEEKVYDGFRVSFNADNHTPNWVAWELLGSETEGEAGRSNKFWQDEELEGCPTTDDYKRSGLDRGHMCPAADQKWSQTAMEDCFVLANICPQDHALNAGAWKTLEEKERQWARRDSLIVIVAGPIYEKSDTQRIGEAGVRVPSAFFKVLLAPALDKPRAIGFVYPNMTAPGNMQNYSMTVDEAAQITGYDFFYNLPDDIENEVESKASFKEWNAHN